jgi:hypothetical protein
MSRGSIDWGEDLPLTLQFIWRVVSKPTNIRIMAMRAVSRQLEYNFAPKYDQEVYQDMMVASHTHIVHRHLLLPLIICHSNQIVVKYSHLPEISTRNKIEARD